MSNEWREVAIQNLENGIKCLHMTAMVVQDDSTVTGIEEIIGQIMALIEQIKKGESK